MIIQYIFILIIMLLILINDIIKPFFSYLKKDEFLNFNGILYENLNKKKYRKILIAIFLNFIVFLLILSLILKIKLIPSECVFVIIMGIMFLKKYILKSLKANKQI